MNSHRRSLYRDFVNHCAEILRIPFNQFVWRSNEITSGELLPLHCLGSVAGVLVEVPHHVYWLYLYDVCWFHCDGRPFPSSHSGVFCFIFAFFR